jgi:hypothetical protein
MLKILLLFLESFGECLIEVEILAAFSFSNDCCESAHYMQGAPWSFSVILRLCFSNAGGAQFATAAEVWSLGAMQTCAVWRRGWGVRRAEE